MTILQDVKDSVEETLTAEEVRRVEWAIKVSSAEATFYSGVSWTGEPPALIGGLISKCVSRWIRNTEGLSQDKTGDVSIGRNLSLGELHATPTFLADEKKILKGYRMRAALNGNAMQTARIRTGMVLRSSAGDKRNKTVEDIMHETHLNSPDYLD